MASRIAPVSQERDHEVILWIFARFWSLQNVGQMSIEASHIPVRRQRDLFHPAVTCAVQFDQAYRLGMVGLRERVFQEGAGVLNGVFSSGLGAMEMSQGYIVKPFKAGAIHRARSSHR